MNESKPEHIANEAMPPFPSKRSDVGRPFHEYTVRIEEGLIRSSVPVKVVGKSAIGKVFMFNDIKPGDVVRVDSWLPVTSVDGDSITIAGAITTGRESIVAHKPKERTPDEIWATLTDDEKRMMIERR